MDSFIEFISMLFGELFFDSMLAGIARRLFGQEPNEMSAGKRRLAMAICFLPAVIALLLIAAPIVFFTEWLKVLSENSRGLELIPARRVLLVAYPIVTGLVILWIVCRIGKARHLGSKK